MLRVTMKTDQVYSIVIAANFYLIYTIMYILYFQEFQRAERLCQMKFQHCAVIKSLSKKKKKNEVVFEKQSCIKISIKIGNI